MLHTISSVFFVASLTNGSAIGGISGAISGFFKWEKITHINKLESN